MNESLKKFLKNLEIIRKNNALHEPMLNLLDLIEKNTLKLIETKTSKYAKDQVIYQQKNFFLETVMTKLNLSKEKVEELKELLILSNPFVSEVPIQETVKYKHKLQWFSQKEKSSVTEKQESIEITNNISSSPDAEHSHSSFPSLDSTKKNNGNMSRIHRSTSEQRLNETDKKKNKSRLNSFSGSNNQLSRNYLNEVRSKFLLCPNVNSAECKIDSRNSSPMLRRNADFIRNNIEAVSSRTIMKR